MSELRGTIWPRANGTWTLQVEKTWDPTKGKSTRPSLGTFPTEDKARQAQLEYTLQATKGIFSMEEVSPNRITVNEYLDGWMDLLAVEERGGKIELRTFLDYDTVVRRHIRPHFGSISIGSLNATLVRKWLLEVKDKGVSDRPVEKAYRTLY